MNRKGLQDLSRVRIAEAKALLKLRHASGAYYLAGYAVECALKACIAKQVNRHDFPPDRKRVEEIYRHSASDLLKAAKLESLLAAALNADETLERNWEIVKSWSERSRYEIHSVGDAQDMIEAAGNPRHGVLPWIKRHW